MTNTTCANCRHWQHDPHELAHYGHRYVGTCSKGGPDPTQGCSDTGPHETCERHQPVAVRGRERA